MTQTNIVRGPVGYCIYCRSNKGKLTKEHIVPEALGGVHVLTRASCDRCRETLNHKVDKPAIRALMQGRAAYGFKSKRPKSRKINVISPPASGKFDGRDFIAEYPVDGYFGSVALPQLSGPPGLLHPEFRSPEFVIWFDARGGGSILMDAPVVEGALCIAAMVAKTAYAAAIFDGHEVSGEELESAIRAPLLHVGGLTDESTVPRGLPYHFGTYIKGDKLICNVQLFKSAPMTYGFTVAFRI